MCKLRLVFIFLLIFLSYNVFAQKEGVVHMRFRALLKSGERIEGKDAYFTSTGFKGILNTGEEITISRNDIRLLEVSEGSKIMQYAAMGAGTGIFLSLVATGLVAYIASLDPYKDKELCWDSIVGGTVVYTGVSTILGGIVGATKTKWTRIPVRTTLNFTPTRKRVMLTVSIPF